MKKVLLGLLVVASLSFAADAPAATSSSSASSAPTVADGKAVFDSKGCATCHGQKAELKPLGHGMVAAGISADTLVKYLKGYQDGTYGGPFKALMKPHADSLDDAQIKAVAKYISSL